MLSSLLQDKYDRHELNDLFFEELANLRYGDTADEKQKYDQIGEKFEFWKSLSGAQKRSCVVDPGKTIRNKKWDVANGITISGEEKMEFLNQRWPVDERTCRILLDRLLNSSEADTTRGETIEKPLSDAFAMFPLSFDKFHNATQSVPESDLFIRGWFERKHAELLNTFGNQKTSQEGTSGSDEVKITYWRTPHGYSSDNDTFWRVDICEKIHKIQSTQKAQSLAAKTRIIYSHISPNESPRNIPPLSAMDLCGEIHSPQQSPCVVPKGKGHPAASLVNEVQKRRHQILNGINPIDMEAFEKHFEALQQKRMAGHVSGNVLSTNSSTSSTGDVLQYPSSEVPDSFSIDPTTLGHNQPSTSAQVRRDLPRSRTMLEELLSGNNTSSLLIQNLVDVDQVSMGNQETQQVSVSNDELSCSEILLDDVPSCSEILHNMSSSSIQNPIDAIQVSVENQETKKTSVSDDGQSSPEILLLNITHPATNRKRSKLQSHRAAPKPKVPATTFDSARTPEIQDSVRSENSGVGVRRSESRLGTNAQQSFPRRIEKPARRNVVEDAGVGDDFVMHTSFEIEYDGPQVPATSSNPAHAYESSFNSIDESIDIIARGEDKKDPERN
ncbi:hypothetical protein L3Y34_013508 [Caenorhabditis briggsae]|uniref:Uncharacterized protein n=1 Tax=Caenorhabditis briggsae TaxID=6238 RepID=A0AAE9CXN5_CAEBR|nr:hypothetical protein L3Y34_013508 [Caenorhabditis briggsae]